MKTNHRSLRRAKNRRNFVASSLVEVLVAIVVGAIVTANLVELFSKLQRVSTTSQNEICANAIAQEMVEATRNLDYDFLAPKIGQTYDLLPNRLTTAQSGPVDFRPDPVLLDFANKSWDQKVISAQFPGNATYKVEAANGIPNAIKATITVTWSDGERAPTSGQPGRSINTSMIITKSGLNRWCR